MKSKKKKFKFLSEYIAYLQSHGTYVFTQKAAQKVIGCSRSAIRMAAHRLLNKGSIVKLRYAFYVIVPLEYITVGAPPPTWYIDALMQHHQQAYYVALLSAATLYGAAHQQPQIFQVITNKPLRSIKVGKVTIEFIIKKDINQSEVIKKPTDTGLMCISSPEITAFDLVKYFNRVGTLSHVATILAELSEAIDAKKLLSVAKKRKNICYAAFRIFIG